jgi:hypothetical protein
MRASKVLIEAKKLIENADNWLKGCYAENKQGRPVGPLDSAACKFCSAGAIQKITKLSLIGDGGSADYCHILMKNTKLAITTYNSDLRLMDFNDSPATTHAMVMQVWQDAIDEQIKKEVDWDYENC